MKNKNSVFIATSLDGFIADKNGGLTWLESIPNPEQKDMGYNAFTKSIDAIIMGRVTFETVLGFGIDWPYTKPVFVLSTTLQKVPFQLEGKVQIINGNLNEVLKSIHDKGFHHLYIDGGNTIQSFLSEDLVDEICVSTIPILLGGGSPLFGKLAEAQLFELKKSEVHLGQIVQSTFTRKR